MTRYNAGPGSVGGPLLNARFEGDSLRVEPARPPVVVVIAEDRASRFRLRGELERFGCCPVEMVDIQAVSTVLTAAGADADVVVVDVDPTSQPGQEMLRELTASLGATVATVPIVIMGVDEAGLDLGMHDPAPDQMHDYLMKPYHPAQLRARVTGAVRLKRLQDELVSAHGRLALQDRLAGVHGVSNRMAVEEALVRAHQSARRHDHSLAIALVEVKTTRRPVDAQAMRIVGAQLVATARATDIVGHWIDDRFLVVMPETQPDGASRAGDRFRSAVASSSLGAATDIILSVGLATASSFAPASVATMLSRAGGAFRH